jgi:hypothetical protein
MDGKTERQGWGKEHQAQTEQSQRVVSAERRHPAPNARAHPARKVEGMNTKILASAAIINKANGHLRTQKHF